MLDLDQLSVKLQKALDARGNLLDTYHAGAFRLFNGFYEGCPDLSADVYARTLVLFGYAVSAEENDRLLSLAQVHFLSRLPWLECVIHKIHGAPDATLRRGRLAYGCAPDRQVCEHGVSYAIDLLMNQDASLYLDTCNLRAWLLANAAGRSVLNMFAYTGALGIAALAGGAARVVQVDRSRKFLDVARRSFALNSLDATKMELLAIDFFSAAAQFKRRGELFDVVIVDPPYFSTTAKGTINLEMEEAQVINKVRPLVKDGGCIVAINNALFLKGADYLAALEELGKDGYLSIDRLVPVPPDFTGYPQTITAAPPVDPAPFNHPTKIAVLKVKRKPAPGFPPFSPY